MRRGRSGSVLALLAGLALFAAPADAAIQTDNAEAAVAGRHGDRPVAPPVADLASATGIDCTSATSSINERDRNRIDEAMAQLRLMGQHSRQLSAWYGEQFIAAGAWSAEEAARFDASLGERPEMAETKEWALGLATTMLADLTGIMEAEQAGNFRGACTALVAMLERLSDAPTRMAAQWAAIDSIYAAAARDAGITLRQ